jgi:hypothetical protein
MRAKRLAAGRSTSRSVRSDMREGAATDAAVAARWARSASAAAAASAAAWSSAGAAAPAGTTGAAR